MRGGLNCSSEEVERTLAPLLDAIRREVLELGVGDHLEVRRLLHGRERWDADELRASIAALLARNPDELRQIEALFDQYVRVAMSPGEAPQQPRGGQAQVAGERAAPRLVDWLVAPITWSTVSGPLLALGVVGFATIVALIALSPAPAPHPVEAAQKKEEQPKPLDSSFPPLPVTPRVVSDQWDIVLIERPRSRVHRPPRLIRSPDLVDLLSILMGCAVLSVGVAWWMLPGTLRSRRKREIEERLARVRAARREAARVSAERGVPMHLPYRVPVHLPFGRKTLDDAVSLLGRVFGQQPGAELDVGATVHSTLREGGRFVPVFEPRRAQRSLLVLTDLERGDQPYVAGFERALDYLARQGVPLIRCHFRYSPEWVVPVAGGQAVHIRDLSRRYGQAVLLVFSRQLSPQSHHAEASWVSELPAWGLKAWIDPDPRRPGARSAGKDDGAELERRGLRRFPWTEDGLLTLATYLGSGGANERPQRWPELPDLADPAVKQAAEKWALCAALVPDATWDQLEAIRRHPAFTEIGGVFHAPRHLQVLLDWTRRQTQREPESGDGRTLELTNELVDRLIREHRKKSEGMPLEATLEARARSLLLEQLEPELPDDPLQRLRWELKMAAHQMVLDPARAFARMAAFFGTAVEEEMRLVLEAELARQGAGLALSGRAVPGAVVQLLRALEGQVEFVTLEDLEVNSRRVPLRVLVASLIAATGMGVASALAMSFDSWKGSVLEVAPSQVQVVVPPTYEVRRGSPSGGRAP